MPKSELLLRLVRTYMESDPALAARRLESMTADEATDILHLLPSTLTAQAFPHFQTGYAAAILEGTDPDDVGALLRRVDAKRVATIFMNLSPEDRERFMPHVPEKLKFEMREHLKYPEGSVGRMMTTQFFAFQKGTTVRDAISKLRAMAKKNQAPASYAYVLGDDARLLGVMNMHQLLLASPEAPLESIMRTDVHSLHGFMSCEDAAAELAKRRYFAAPIVDNENRMLGIIRAEHLIQEVRDEVTEDLLRMCGAGGDEQVFSPMRFSLRKRLPWLHVNLLTAFLAAAVVAMFQDTIAQITVLAVFLPVVAGQGGNAGAQSLAIVMRGLVMREIPKHKTKYLILKESSLGLINGLIVGAVTAGIAILWYGNAALGLVIGLGMIVNLFVAGMAGASIPLIMRAFRLDPAQCASIILTTVTDVIGFLAFLGFAVMMKGRLM